MDFGMRKRGMANKLRPNSRRGAVLLEVLVAVAILSSSIVVILQSMVSSARAASRARNYMEACNVLDNKIAEFLIMPQTLLSQSPGPADTGSDPYLFHISHGQLPFGDDDGLQLLSLKQEWGHGRRKVSIDVPLVYYDAKP